MPRNQPDIVFLHLLAIICMLPMALSLQDRGQHPTICQEPERLALLQFKAGLNDRSSRLSSWVGADCCSWSGVGCNNQTGHVISLDLHSPDQFDQGPVNSEIALIGPLDQCLLTLSKLAYLDLSGNFFQQITIPEFIGSFKELAYLDLSNVGFSGEIPHQLGNLTSLRYFKLSQSIINNLYVSDPAWLSGLTSLQYFDMSAVKFSEARDWLQALNMLPSLLQVQMSNCALSSIPLALPHFNLTSLQHFDLSSNGISSEIPTWLFELCKLRYLDLSDNHFHGTIQHNAGDLKSLQFLALSGAGNKLNKGTLRGLGSLCRLGTLKLQYTTMELALNELGEFLSGCIKGSLQILDLSNTRLTGILPHSLWDLPELKSLDLSDNLIYGSILIPAQINKTSLREINLESNNLNGTVSEGLGNLVELVDLNLSQNNLEGVLSEAHFANLTRLQALNLNGNSQLRLSHDWAGPFQLQSIHMGSCQLGPQFPAWLQPQWNFTSLDFSNAGITDVLPVWFWNSSSGANYVDLSNNMIRGKLPTTFSSDGTAHRYIYLNSNRFEGALPGLHSNAIAIDLSNNLLSGHISSTSTNNKPVSYLERLSLSGNHISGSIPPFLCRSELLVTLDLSNNYLSGEIPGCWNSSLLVMDLSDNRLTGGIPDAIGSLALLESLHLRNNRLSGEVTSSLERCRYLIVLDLGSNKFTGEVPAWNGEHFPNLKFLSLRSNMLTSRIPAKLSSLKALQVLDISNNNLFGPIPHEFGNFTAMRLPHQLGRQGFGDGYRETISLTTKGRETEYDPVLGLLVTAMDLSSNSLSGTIPDEIVNLVGLHSLNLSGNLLTGEITSRIGELRLLESLDLSSNRFFGKIPSTLSSLNFLDHLNLSYNNLTGSIPCGNQLQTLDDTSIYIGNPHLCGYLLRKTCLSGKKGAQASDSAVVDDDRAILYAATGLGFATGLWVVCGILVISERRRSTYFRFTDSMLDGSCGKGAKYPIAIGWILIVSVFLGLAAMWNWMFGHNFARTS